MINGLRAPLFSDSFRGRKEVVPDTTTPLKWCRLSLFFVASHEYIHQGSNWYIYIQYSPSFSPIIGWSFTITGPEVLNQGITDENVSLCVNKLKLFGTFPKCWWSTNMGLSENRARKYPWGIIIFQIELPRSTARFQTHLNFQFASEVHMGARTLHPASVAWQSWSLPDNSRVLRLCPDLSGRVWEWGSIPKKTGLTPASETVLRKLCFGNHGSEPIIRNYASESMLRQPRRGTMFGNPKPQSNRKPHLNPPVSKPK